MRRWQDMTAKGWKRPEILLLIFAAAAPLSFSTWQALLNNFAIERAAFTGAEMGILQSLREVPGFLAFAVVFVLLLIREQSLAYLSLVALGLGTALTGFFPSVAGLYVNAGHGHLGWTMAAGSAALLADMMEGKPPAVDAAPFQVHR